MYGTEKPPWSLEKKTTISQMSHKYDVYGYLAGWDNGSQEPTGDFQ